MVVCINDSKLPLGANVVKGQEYEILEQFVNNFDQVVYIIGGVVNGGKTRFDLPWYGYNSDRFAQVEDIEETIEEVIEEVI